jgi:hypothetical protein
MSDRISAGAPPPMLVGSFLEGGKRRFLPTSWNEIERARTAAAGWLRTFGFPRGANVISSFTSMDNAQATPFDRGAGSLGLIPCSAEVQRNEARRFEMITRRFDVVGVAVASDDVLSGFDDLGLPVEQVFKGCVMWLRPEAYDRLLGTPGVHIRRWVDLGPAVAFECVVGEGAHVDGKEWEVEEVDGHVMLTSRLSRSLQFRGWRSDIRGEVRHGLCRCGSFDPRVIPTR